jgi:PilZ domain
VVKAIFIEVMPPKNQRREPSTIIRCETVDVSVKGLCVLVSEPVEPGRDLNIAVPEEGWVENLELTGVSRWIKPAEDSEGHWLGLELQDTDRDSMEKWFQIVNDLQSAEVMAEYDRL